MVGEACDRFEAVYLAHAGAVRRFARRRMDPAEADDLVAEVFLTVWRRFDELPADPLPWVLRIARGVLANRRRGDERRAALTARLISERPAGSDPVQGEGDLAVVTALSGLSVSDQELLLLVAWERLSTEQLAATLGVSRGGYQYLIRVVPDDVSKVVFVVRGHLGRLPPGTTADPSPATITAIVHDNVAAARIRRQNPAGKFEAIWYDAAGRVVKRSFWP